MRQCFWETYPYLFSTSVQKGYGSFNLWRYGAREEFSSSAVPRSPLRNTAFPPSAITTRSAMPIPLASFVPVAKKPRNDIAKMWMADLVELVLDTHDRAWERDQPWQINWGGDDDRVTHCRCVAICLTWANAMPQRVIAVRYGFARMRKREQKCRNNEKRLSPFQDKAAFLQSSDSARRWHIACWCSITT